ncbi:MAG: tetratricopeptide repeat protein [Candidatus Marinimicrobia bacterium]|nr:tetratricopeptide repeat protein [Candidatus Neomarinimicrobiota bacterium]
MEIQGGYHPAMVGVCSGGDELMDHHYKLMLFSPQHSDYETLNSTLTKGRRRLAKVIQENLQQSIKIGKATHFLLIGPRGSGKTHLLTYITSLLKEKQTKKLGFKIYRFSEEERGITSLMDVLHAAIKSTGSFSEEEIISRIPRGDPDGALSAMEEIFLKHTDNQTSIIIIENIEFIFRGLKKKGQHDLRGFLQTHTNISLLASSIELFSGSQAKAHPFYGFFRIEHLDRLDEGEAKEFLIMLARLNQDSALVAELLKDQAMKRVRAIYALTGGNHRLLAMLSCFLNNDGLEELVQPFIQFADRELTPYYQQRLDRLSAQQNKILGVIAQQGGRAVNVSDIAARSFLDSRIVSRQLHDMLYAGFVRRNKIGRESYYELNEPLLRIVMDIKESRGGLLPLIVSLLRNWYEAKELKQLEDSAPEGISQYYRAAQAAEHAAIHIEPAKATDITRHGKIDQEIPTVHSAEGEHAGLIRTGIESALKENHSKAIKLFSAVLRQDSENLPALYNRALSYRSIGKQRPALKDLNQIILLYNEAEEGNFLVIADATIIKGNILSELGRPKEQIAYYAQVIERFGNCKEPVLLVRVAQALFNKGVILGQLDRPKEAAEVYDEVAKRFGERKEPELLEQVARALVNKGVILGQLDRPEEEIAAYNEVVERFGEHEEPELLKQVAMALVNKGVVLGRLDRSKEAVEVYDEVAKRFSEHEEPELLKLVAMALVNKGVTLDQLERSKESIEVYDEVAKRFSEREEPELLEQVARALFNKGVALGQLDRPEESIEIYDDIVERFSKRKEPELLERVAMALHNKGYALSLMNRPIEGIAVYDEIVRRFGGSNIESLSQSAVEAMNKKAAVLIELGQPQEALAEYDSILDKSADNLSANYNRIYILIKSGRTGEAISNLRAALDPSLMDEDERGALASLLITGYINEESHLHRIIETFIEHDATKPLVMGLIAWLQGLMPIAKADADRLMGTEEMLGKLLADVLDAQPVLSMLKAAAADAQGDKKALLALPLELRRLIQSAKGDEVDD